VAGLKQIWTLVAYQMRRRARSIVIWGVALGALGALYVALFPTMSGILEQYMEQAPEGMRQYLGEIEGSMTIEQWLGIEFVNGLIPIALPFMVMAIGARAVAGREERKTLDLLLCNPVPRWRVIAAAAGTMALSLACVLVITWILTCVAAPLAGVDLSPTRLAAGLAALWPMCLVFGALALLASALVRRAFLAIVIPSVVLVAMYVIDSLGTMSKSVEPIRVVSLFYHLGRPLEGDFPWTGALLSVLAVCVLGFAAGAAFARRDIYT
jgi:ABC-2 type transport system permease protein